MKIIRSTDEMRRVGRDFRQRGIRLGLVPTMGCLHEGHLSLLRLLDGRCDLKAASIFVNPIQFGAGEDLETYPRDEARDFALLEREGCHVVFHPDAAEMYPSGYQTFVEVAEVSKPLCGRFRPGHFRGVATVVLRLFNLTGCATAAFGLKDYQQAMVIRRMVEDLHLDVELVFGPTVREPDGLALSSRNAYLSPDERTAATAIPRALEWAQSQVKRGVDDCVALRDGMAEILSQKRKLNIQYLETVDPETLAPRERVGDGVLIALAVFVGSTRLIDNLMVGPGMETQLIPGTAV